jgi:hypothetical protein
VLIYRKDKFLLAFYKETEWKIDNNTISIDKTILQ